MLLLLTCGNELAPLAFMGVKQRLVLCTGALFRAMWPMWSWPQKLCDSKNNALTFLVFSFLLFCQNLFILLSSSSFCACKPPPFVPAMPHCAIFNPSCPFLSIQTMLTCDILFHTPSDRPSNKADTMVCLKRCSPVPRMMQRASANLSSSNGYSQGDVGVLHKHLLWLFCFDFNFNYFCLGKFWLFIILKLVKLAQCWKKKKTFV